MSFITLICRTKCSSHESIKYLFNYPFSKFINILLMNFILIKQTNLFIYLFILFYSIYSIIRFVWYINYSVLYILFLFWFIKTVNIILIFFFGRTCSHTMQRAVTLTGYRRRVAIEAPSLALVIVVNIAQNYKVKVNLRSLWGHNLQIICKHIMPICFR